MSYYIVTKSPWGTVEGKTPVSADEALRIFRRAAGTLVRVEVHDEQGKTLSREPLQSDVSRPHD